MKNENNNKTIKIAGVILIALAILIFIFANGNKTYTINENENKVVTGLDCIAESIDGAFFSPSVADITKNQIKLTFDDDKVDKMSYFFEGSYGSYEVAEQENANFHAKYNIYLGSNNIDHESLTPTFLTAETKMRINLYIKNRDMINKITATLFFINEDDVDNYLEYSRDQVADYYEKQGFLCEKQN